jgi:hypothetical protein
MKRKPGSSSEEEGPKKFKAISILVPVNTGTEASWSNSKKEGSFEGSDSSSEEENSYGGDSGLPSLLRKEGSTELHIAAKAGNAEQCQKAFDTLPMAMHISDDDGYIPLEVAIIGGHFEACEVLINKMAQFADKEAIYKFEHTDDTTLELVAGLDTINEGHIKIFKALLDSVSEIALKNGDYGGLLRLAAYKGHKEICELIFKENPDAIKDLRGDGCNAVLLAAQNGFTEITKWLTSEMCIEDIFSSLYTEKKLLTTETTIDHDKTLLKNVSVMISDYISKEAPKGLLDIWQDNFSYHFKFLKLCAIFSNHINKDIVANHFMLMGVCKSINEDSPISILVNSDCMSHMLSYLTPYSLCIELFPIVELSGDTSVSPVS